MEAAIIGVIGRIAPLLFGFLQQKYKQIKGLEEDIRSITNEFKLICATIEEAGDHPLRSGGNVHMKWIEIVRDLARDIEDCVDKFMHQAPKKSSKISTAFSTKFAEEIQKLKQRSVDARAQKATFITKEGTGDGGGEGEAKAETLAYSKAETLAYTDQPVGMEAALRELMDLISETPQDQPKKLKVISIVGFGGIGKSQLADYAYKTIDGSEYEERAWVSAAGKGAGDVLKEIHRQVTKNSTTSSSSGGTEDRSYNLSKLRPRVKEYLDKKRFFIVIDGLQTSCWGDIKDAFPVIVGVSSRVIITTATHSIATKCSVRDGHVYVMRTLDDKESRELFFVTASLDLPPQPDDTQLCSQVIKKCGGLPLALVTTAGVLSSNPTREEWAVLGKKLGEFLQTKQELVSMEHVLNRSYTSLGSQEIKTCLLYLGIYPSGHPIRRGSLIRKWLAEGLIKEDPNSMLSSTEIAVRNFNQLVDQSIIQPSITHVSSINNSAAMKTCQTQGMMLEFILHKSMCQNFVTLLYDKDPPCGSKIRWLSMQQNARCKMDPEDLPLVRSLTIFGEANNSFLDFSKYKLLKVLDLEECGVKMEDSHLKDICTNLLLLRYLSLGAAVKVKAFPEEIENLVLLETLDVRRTKIEILHTRVLKLPCLVHLFGKLKRRSSSISKMIGDWTLGELKDWLLKNSKLETLAGFVVDEGQEMPQLMQHMEHLTKVKIWCESTPDSEKIKYFRQAIMGFIERGTSWDNAPSLSLNFNTEWHQQLLYLELKRDRLYYLRSLKLQGSEICSTLPSFLTMLGGLTKLCLSFPGHGHKLSSGFLDALIKVPHLEYLKLVATELNNLVIWKGALGNLRRLCVVVEVMTGLEVQKGALPRLDSLWLLCMDLNGFSGTMIQSLPLLKEVALHNGLSSKTKQDWQREAKEHRRRPKVLFAETKLIRSEPAVDIRFVAPATDTTAEGVATPATAIPIEESVPDVTSETASKPATTTGHMLSMNRCTIATTQKENHVDGQHDDSEMKYNDNSDESKEFATENSSSTSTESSGVEIGGKDQRMEDDTQVPAKKEYNTRVTPAVDILAALQMIPDLARSDMLKYYGKFIHSERLFEAFMGLPMDMKKEWLMLMMNE